MPLIPEKRFNWLVLVPRDPKESIETKDGGPAILGLHDSGFRYLKLIGVRYKDDGSGTIQEELWKFHDHVMLHGPCNIDVTPEG